MARRPPGRPRGATLTVDDIVDTAVDLAEADGLGKLTVQALADRLGVGRTTVYHHVGALDTVVDAVCDRVVGGFPTPGTDPADWRRWYEEMLTGARRTMLRFDGVARRIRTVGPRSPHQLALVERATGVLVDAGFSTRTAALGYGTLIAVTCDSVEFVELRRAEQSSGMPARIDWHRLLNAGHVSPTLDAVLPVFLEVTNEELFMFAVTAVLDGLHRQLDMEGDPNMK